MKKISELNELLMQTYDLILKAENNVVKQGPFSDLSVTEIHTIEAIGRREGRTMGEIAARLNVAVSTLTVSINRLIKKGYAERVRDQKDRRQVFVHLTKKGEKAYLLHGYFHSAMINTTLKCLTEQESEVLVCALEKVNEFFKDKVIAEDAH